MTKKNLKVKSEKEEIIKGHRYILREFEDGTKIRVAQDKPDKKRAEKIRLELRLKRLAWLDYLGLTKEKEKEEMNRLVKDYKKLLILLEHHEKKS